ncbi:MAG: 2-isopropylmalate synthase [bacterium]|nr:2-isopropylmalate synthase [bacterium]
MKNNNKNKIIIFDTTLRDGEQSPGASLNTAQKIEIGRQLAKMKVDVIEAGFPISSPGDFESVKLIAQEVKGPQICGLARAMEKDIDACWNSVKYSKRPRIHTFLATSDIHLKYKLKMSREEALSRAVSAVKYARRFCDNVEFSAEDAVRSNQEFLWQVVEAVIKAGATTVNIPDTVGYSIPAEFAVMLMNIFDKVPNVDKAVISVHCHNDLGLSVANSLAAVAAGVRQVECTVNGLGERAGNASLEEIVMAIKTRKDLFNVHTDIETKEIYKTSRMVSSLTGIPVQPNKAIVGANAFAHEAGIHQHGVMADKSTYEIMDAKSIGWQGSGLVLGKHSGRHALKQRLNALGYTFKEKDLDKISERFKVLADKKKEIFDEDLIAIVEDEISQVVPVYKLDYIHTVSGSQTIPTATIRLRKGDKVIQEASSGDGPVDATYKAIDRITGLKCKLMEYGIRAVSGGQDAQGEVIVRISDAKGHVVTGQGASTDIIEASAKAYLNAVNRLLSPKAVKSK